MRGHISTVNTLVVSNDNQWIVSGSDDKTVRIWDMASRTELGKTMLGHTEKVTSVAVSPDGEFVASASTDRTVCYWGVRMRRLVMTFADHEESVDSVAFSIDGKRIISGSDDYTIRVREVNRGMLFGALKTSSRVMAVAVSPDGHWFASALSDRTVLIWSMSMLTVTLVLEDRFGPITSVAYLSDDGLRIFSSSDGMVRVWNVQTGEVVGYPLIGHSYSVNSVAHSPNGHELAACSYDGSICVWDMLGLYKRDNDKDNSESGSEDLRIRWNASRAHVRSDNGWVRDGEQLLLWVPPQYRHDIVGGTRLLIGSNMDKLRPKVDYRKLLGIAGRGGRIFTR